MALTPQQRQECLNILVLFFLYCFAMFVVASVSTLLGLSQRLELNQILINNNPTSALVASIGDKMQFFGSKDTHGNVQAIYAARDQNTVFQFNTVFLDAIISPHLTMTFQFFNRTALQVKIRTPTESFVVHRLLPFYPELGVPDATRLNSFVNPYAGSYFTVQDMHTKAPIDHAVVAARFPQQPNDTIIAEALGSGLYYLRLPNSAVHQALNMKSVESIFRSNARKLYWFNIDEICKRIHKPELQLECRLIEKKSYATAAAMFDIADNADKIYEQNVELFDASSFEVAVVGNQIIGEYLFSVKGQDATKMNTNTLEVVSLHGTCNEPLTFADGAPTGRIYHVGELPFGASLNPTANRAQMKIISAYDYRELYDTGCTSQAESASLNVEHHDYAIVNVTKCDPSISATYTVTCNNLHCKGDKCACGPSQLASMQRDNPIAGFGCGSLFSASFFLSMKIGETFGFAEACNSLAVCYGSCNAAKTTCDTTFCSKLQTSCTTKWQRESDQQKCKDAATNYCSHLAIVGASQFKNAQFENCAC